MSLERIEVTSFPLLLGDIITGRRSGTLTVIRQPVRRILFFNEGELSLITSNSIQDSLGSYLYGRGMVEGEQALQLTPEDWTDSVPLLHEGGVVDVTQKDRLLREWMFSLALPLFSLTEGTAVFMPGEPLPARKRISLKSTPAFVLEGIRSIGNGLVLRRSLGDIQRKIEPAKNPPFSIASIPMNERELSVAMALEGPETLEAFIRRVGGDSAGAARAIITMLTLGLFVSAQARAVPMRRIIDDHDTQADLMLLASIGSDPRGLEAASLAKQLPTLDHYEFLGVPQRATHNEIVNKVADLRRKFDPGQFPPIVKDSVNAIRRRIGEALTQLGDPAKRQEYDEMLQHVDRSKGQTNIQQKLARRATGEKNYQRASRLAARGDFYGAIVLLRQAVDYAPDHADAWFLLGSCQERNPQWHHLASESLQKALAIDPNHVEALLALGDLYRSQGLESRAESCYEEILQIDDTNPRALKRLGRKAKQPEE